LFIIIKTDASLKNIHIWFDSKYYVFTTGIPVHAYDISTSKEHLGDYYYSFCPIQRLEYYNQYIISLVVGTYELDSDNKLRIVDIFNHQGGQMKVFYI